MPVSPNSASRNGDQEAGAYADGLLMAWSKAVVVTRFDKPAESMLSGGPEHKIQDSFDGRRVSYGAGFVRMNPLWTSAGHELHLRGEVPRLLEQKIGIPFPGVTAEKRRNTRFKLQPVLYRRNFNREIATETRSATLEAMAGGRPELDDGDLVFLVCMFVRVDIG